MKKMKDMKRATKSRGQVRFPMDLGSEESTIDLPGDRVSGVRRKKSRLQRMNRIDFLRAADQASAAEKDEAQHQQKKGPAACCSPSELQVNRIGDVCQWPSDKNGPEFNRVRPNGGEVFEERFDRETVRRSEAERNEGQAQDESNKEAPEFKGSNKPVSEVMIEKEGRHRCGINHEPTGEADAKRRSRNGRSFRGAHGDLILDLANNAGARAGEVSVRTGDEVEIHEFHAADHVRRGHDNEDDHEDPKGATVPDEEREKKMGEIEGIEAVSYHQRRAGVRIDRIDGIKSAESLREKIDKADVANERNLEADINSNPPEEPNANFRRGFLCGRWRGFRSAHGAFSLVPDGGGRQFAVARVMTHCGSRLGADPSTSLRSLRMTEGKAGMREMEFRGNKIRSQMEFGNEKTTELILRQAQDDGKKQIATDPSATRGQAALLRMTD